MVVSIDHRGRSPSLPRARFSQSSPSPKASEKAPVHPEPHTLPSFRVHLLVALMTLFSFFSTARLGGLKLRLRKGICNPGPLPGLSLLPLLLAGIRDLEKGDSVLDLGTGSGVWALLATRSQASVTATDLPGVSLAQVAENAKINSLEKPELVQGDLFEAVGDRRFKRILFNPPFHVGTPTTAAQRAYLGGSNGNVLHRFFTMLPNHLETGGSACIILPEIEHRYYAPAMSDLEVVERASKWVPILGRVKCLELKRK